MGNTCDDSRPVVSTDNDRKFPHPSHQDLHQYPRMKTSAGSLQVEWLNPTAHKPQNSRLSTQSFLSSPPQAARWTYSSTTLGRSVMRSRDRKAGGPQLVRLCSETNMEWHAITPICDRLDEMGVRHQRDWSSTLVHLRINCFLRLRPCF